MLGLVHRNLSANAFTGVVLTRDQFDFLRAIPTLVVDSFGSTSCSSAAQQQLGGTIVCVAGSVSSGGSSHLMTNSGTVVGGVIAAIAGVVLIVGSVLWMRRRRACATDEKASHYSSILETETIKQGTGASKEASANNHFSSQSFGDDEALASLRVSFEDIEDIERIGAGAFGIVWLVRYRGTQLIASKRLKRDEATWQRRRDFVAEIKLVSRMDHPYILPLIGVAWTAESDLQALFEYMVNGDLRSYLVENAEDFRGVWTAEKLHIMMNVANALVYLHSYAPPLVHRDLKSRNVLLGAEMQAKVSDFGVSRFQSEQGTMTAGIGTGKWLAPEVIVGNSDYNQSCDIFSFGVVLSEMDTHDLPYERVRGAQGNELNEVAVLQLVAAGSLRPSFTPECPPQILSLAQRCLSLNPSERPTAYQVLRTLRAIEASGDY